MPQPFDKFILPPSARGKLSIETDIQSGEKRICFTQEFLRSLSLESLTKVMSWATNDLEELDRWIHDNVKPEQVMCLTEDTVSESDEIDRSGFVYLLQSGDAYKIGRAREVGARLAQISPIMPHPVTLLHWIRCYDCRRIESELHEKFKAKRLQGEWFGLTEADVEIIKGLAQGDL